MKGAGRDALLLVALKSLLGAWVLHLGFTHVSDDDYSRVVIAQLFAHTPKLDPSGTSWLPFPFWTMGGAMIVFGRSLDVARGIAFVFGAISVVPPYLAMRAVGAERIVACVATGVAAVTPWSAWLGVATVPEALTGGLVAAGAIAAAASGRARVWGGAALLAAALSRYETWGACAIVCAVSAWRAIAAWKASESLVVRLSAIAFVLCALGPVAWIAWNGAVHGEALHFVARVARFQRALGADEAPLAERLFTYPYALVASAPIGTALGVAGVVGLRDRELRRRWGVPLAAAGAILAFLIVSAVRETTATHHPERAVVGVLPVLAGAGVDAIRAWTVSSRAAAWRPVCWAIGAACVALTAFGCRMFPGASAADDRSPQLAQGADLARRCVARIEVVPCEYEHFALMAAFGRPEDVEVRPLTHGHSFDERCPLVIEASK